MVWHHDKRISLGGWKSRRQRVSNGTGDQFRPIDSFTGFGQFAKMTDSVLRTYRHIVETRLGVVLRRGIDPRIFIEGTLAVLIHPTAFGSVRCASRM